MKLYIVRHAEAEPSRGAGEAADAARELTERGHRRAARAGAVLARLGVEPNAIWTSPLIRARQTADRLAAALPEAPVQQIQALGGRSDFNELRRQLYKEKCDAVILVGHQPFLGECVQYWLAGRAHPGMHVSKSSIICLDVVDGFGRAEMELKYLLSNRLIKLLATQD